ncbi:MAG TPA: hypothetical protein VMC79_16140 [Rectinemataceae bacterium]|nr:hypothetical protein [Rectinemataceae bacterium]
MNRRAEQRRPGGKGDLPPAGLPSPRRAATGAQPSPTPRGRRRPIPPAAEPVNAEAPPPTRRRTQPRRSEDAQRLCQVEVVQMYLYDIGRSADLKKVAALIPAHADMGIVKRRDTPASLSLPKPLILQVGDHECHDLDGFNCFSARIKIYEEGAVTVIVRVKARIPFGELHRVGDRAVLIGDEADTLKGYAEKAARRLIESIRGAVIEPHDFDVMDTECYTAYCLLDCGEEPGEFLRRNRDYAAALLIGEDPASRLHQSQITATLGKPFSYHQHDLAVFDLDRCLIIDSEADYEDLLLIVEHANYQLLELRVLDKLLDHWLDEAEDDVRLLYEGSARRRRGGGSAAKIKLANIQALRFESLFILENLENSSKIIGDYYLGQVYDRLCSIFNTDGWKWSVERRLDALQNVYDMVKTDSGERRMITLEIIFIVVCIIFPVVQIVQVMLTSTEQSRPVPEVSLPADRNTPQPAPPAQLAPLQPAPTN